MRNPGLAVGPVPVRGGFEKVAGETSFVFLAHGGERLEVEVTVHCLKCSNTRR